MRTVSENDTAKNTDNEDLFIETVAKASDIKDIEQAYVDTQVVVKLHYDNDVDDSHIWQEQGGP